MLATLVDAPFDDKRWIFETKWDGFRLITEKRGHAVRLWSRNGIDVTTRYAMLLPALQKIDGSCVIDGELGTSCCPQIPSSDLIVDFALWKRLSAARALERARIADCFAVTVSGEEVAAGKPAPDVYLTATRRLGVDPADAAAVEDSTNGLRAAAAAGTVVIASPNREYPPEADALALAALVVESLDELTPEAIESAAQRARKR